MRVAIRERITGIADRARTHWRMISNIANGIYSTRSRARIATLFVYAGVIAGTVRVYNTFWAAIWR